jgi:hypothetical protein
MCRTVVALLLSISTLDFAWGQGTPLVNPIFGSTNSTYKRHYAPTGKPCLTISADARPQVVNKDMIDHWVIVANECSQRIKVQICYYHTQACIVVDAPPYGRKDTVLGVYPKLRDFRYEYKEQF